jgi:tetratricopeptide (TPR) repeat protein
VSVQLVKVSDEYHIWSETYDRTLEDIFAVQDDIAQSVVKELRTALLGEEADSDASRKAKAEVVSAAKGRGTNPEAYRLYLLARHFMGRFTRADTEKAIEYQKQALVLDPEFALAWVELGWAHCREADYGWVPAIEGYRRAREAAERALALEPNLAEGHAETGWIQMIHEWDWRGAGASFRRALELAPGNAVVLRRTGVFESSQGRIEAAIEFYRRALEQDPLDSHTYNNIGLAFYEVDRHREAESAHRKALELAPQRAGSHEHISMTLIAQGRGEEALAEASLEPDEATRLRALAIVQNVLGNRGESDKDLQELIDKHADVCAWDVAEVHAARGEVDAAFRWLERAYAQRDGGLSSVKSSPLLRSLHDEPRWAAFLNKMGFDD